MNETYLVWSVEHYGWWHRNGHGYASRLSEARLFTRDGAMAVCLAAIPGQAERLGFLHELPVRLADVKAMQADYHRAFPHLPIEDWE